MVLRTRVLKLLVTVPFSHFKRYLFNRIEAWGRAQTTKNRKQIVKLNDRCILDIFYFHQVPNFSFKLVLCYSDSQSRMELHLFVGELLVKCKKKRQNIIMIYSTCIDTWASLVGQWVNNLLAMQETQGLIPASRRHCNPLQQSCQENPMDRGT